MAQNNQKPTRRNVHEGAHHWKAYKTCTDLVDVFLFVGVVKGRDQIASSQLAQRDAAATVAVHGVKDAHHDRQR